MHLYLPYMAAVNKAAQKFPSIFNYFSLNVMICLLSCTIAGGGAQLRKDEVKKLRISASHDARSTS